MNLARVNVLNILEASEKFPILAFEVKQMTSPIEQITNLRVFTVLRFSWHERNDRRCASNTECSASSEVRRFGVCVNV